MYKSARIKLTIIYSLLFFVTLWLTSGGLYYWFGKSLGEGYITEVGRRNQAQPNGEVFSNEHRQVVIVAGSVALDQLRDGLLLLNGILLLAVPALSWYLTGKTLAPIQRSYNRQKQFVSDASHELRTPLSIISGEMEVALRKVRSKKDYKGILLSAKSEVNRLIDLVESLLLLAKEDNRKNRIVYQNTDLTDILGGIISSYNYKIQEKKLNIKFEPPDESVVIRGHEAQLKMLFSNLLDNAIKYSREQGKIFVKIFRRGNVAVTEIKDRGSGINKENLIKIFDRFYREDYARSETKGFGLGLALAKAVAERHKGKIEVESKTGIGSKFTVYLPIV